jgi:hypothetical protein
MGIKISFSLSSQNKSTITIRGMYVVASDAFENKKNMSFI